LQYSEAVSEYFDSPVNAGDLPADALRGEAGDRERGIHVVFGVRIADERIEDIRFQAFGCPHSIAACCLATERLRGQPVQALESLAAEDLAAQLEVPVEKMGRLLVIQDALQNCFLAWDNSWL
jgi:NifU-like protein involved in Fe-S cluster formation